MSLVWRIVAVVVGGVVGTIANSVVVAALTENAFWALALGPGRLAVAIVVAALLPLIYVRLSGAAAAVTAVLALTVIPSLLAKLVFGIVAPWGFVLAVNAVYALAAWATWLGMARALPRAR
jgi:hypothetical protein